MSATPPSADEAGKYVDVADKALSVTRRNWGQRGVDYVGIIGLIILLYFIFIQPQITECQEGWAECRGTVEQILLDKMGLTTTDVAASSENTPTATAEQ